MFGGVDSRTDTLHVAVIGGRLAEAEFAITAAGYAAALAFLTAHGHGIAIGVEGTSSYGACFTRAARFQRLHVVEINRPDQDDRRRRAVRASYRRTPRRHRRRHTHPAQRRPLRGPGQARIAALSRNGNILFTAPETIRTKYGQLKSIDRTGALARLRPAGDTVPIAVVTALKNLA